MEPFDRLARGHRRDHSLDHFETARLYCDMKRTRSTTLVVGVDTGGTFTDIVYRQGRRRGSYKLLSTPGDPAVAVIDGLSRLFGESPADRLTYGTTVATNAILQNRGARTALVTTAGFEDVIEIGRQARPRLHELEPRVEEPLVPRSRRLGIRERVLFDGKIDVPLTRAELASLRKRLERAGVESVAVCLLHAHTEPVHEKSVAAALSELGVPLTLSHELSPAPGEYERTTTCVVNAFVRPMVERHVRGLAQRSRARVFRVMQSNGGSTGLETASCEPVRTMLSGPAGGVAAAFETARLAGIGPVVTLDMGGTSTDVALVDGAVSRRSVTKIGAVPVRTPCIDIHTVGAGGGSIARVDEGGSLKVGPLSAGADPGPACYGKGTEVTVTDANLVLGRLIPDEILGGAISLDGGRATRVLRRLQREMRARSLDQAADGIIRVVEANMERAIRVITVERGHDPRSCTLMAFGGAAGLHACGLAAQLGMNSILVPPEPGLFSARGVMDGPLTRDLSASVRIEDPRLDELENRAASLRDRATAEASAEGLPSTKVRLTTWVRMRYLGQAIELEVPLRTGFRVAFDREHQRLFHHSDPRRQVEACGLRVTAEEEFRSVRARESSSTGLTAARSSTRGPKPRASAKVFVGGRRIDTPVYDRLQLGTDGVLRGPGIVTEYSSTLFLAEGWALWVDEQANLRLELERGN